MTNDVALHVLHHGTRYRYDRAVHLGPQVIRLCPRPQPSARTQGYLLELAPHPTRLEWLTDAYGNRVARAHFDTALTELRIDVSLQVDLTHRPQPEPAARGLDGADDAVLDAYREPIGPNPTMQAWLSELLPGAAASANLPLFLCAEVARRIAYRARHEPGVQTPDESLALGSGSCRDSAWLLMAMLRHAGWPARFVSGYLIQTASGELRESSDQSAADTGLHAWCEAHVDGLGWVGLDATSGRAIGPGHVALACAPMPWQAAPVEGSVERCHVDFSHSITVRACASA